MGFHGVDGFDLTKAAALILDSIPLGVTVIDLEGRIQYYNERSSRILDRKPEYLSKDIRICHQKQESIAEIERVLEEFRDGRRQDVHYDAIREGKRIVVTVSPFVVEGRLIGCVQSVLVNP